MRKVKFNYPVAFVFGNEKKGLENKVINECDYSIHIEMFGMANSLNLAVCSGIIISEAVNQYIENFSGMPPKSVMI